MAFKNKEDQATYHREVWYPKNKQRRLELNNAWKEKQVDLFKEWKSKQKCLICSESEYSCLDLHHLNPADKEYAIAVSVRQMSFEKLMKELSKCVVLCANCHRKVHAGIIQLEEYLPCNEAVESSSLSASTK